VGGCPAGREPGGAGLTSMKENELRT